MLHGVPQPYPGWREQMQAARLRWPRPCCPIRSTATPCRGANEIHGESIYHSLQAKLEKRFSAGTYALVSYTFGKIITSGADNIQQESVTWSGASGVISPFEEERNRSLAADDVAHVLSAALVYELPVGKGKKYLDQGGLTNALLGGWQLSTVFRYSTGIPFFFRSSFCNVPSQFRVGCIPALKPGANPFAPGRGQLRPRPRVRSSTRTPSSPWTASTSTTARAPGSAASAGRAIATTTSLSSRTRALAGGSTCSSASRPSTSGTGTTSRPPGRIGQVCGNIVRHRSGQPGLRQVDRHRDQPESGPASGAAGVLIWDDLSRP